MKWVIRPRPLNVSRGKLVCIKLDVARTGSTEARKTFTMEFYALAAFALFSSFCNVLALSPKGKTSPYHSLPAWFHGAWTWIPLLCYPPLFSAVCLLQVDEGPCREEIERYYYNTITQKCELFSYGGCQGNDNNFKSFQECQKTCFRIPSKYPESAVSPSPPTVLGDDRYYTQAADFINSFAPF